MAGRSHVPRPAARILIALVICLASVAAMAADRFASERPSPLKSAGGGNSEETIVRFTGKVELSGRFIVAWDLVNRAPRYLRVTFLPDHASAMLLPHAVGSPAVEELMLSNNEAAAKLLLDPDAAARVLAKEALALEGDATVTIGDYQSVIDCDQRWYLARLLAVASRTRIAVAGDARRRGC
jgi:hypothetical protein